MSNLRALKVFCTGEEQKKLISDLAIERWGSKGKHYITYPGFVVVHVPREQADQICSRFAYEDLTEQFKLDTDADELHKTDWQIEYREGELSPATVKYLSSLDSGPHHYLVQFNGPVKRSWINALRRKKIEFREPYKTFTHVVRCTASRLRSIYEYPYVRWVGHLPHYKRDLVNVEAFADPSSITSGTLVVEFFSPGDLRKAKSRIWKIGRELAQGGPPVLKIISTRELEGVLTIKAVIDPADIFIIANEVSKVHGVRVIRPWVIKQAKNDVASEIMGVDAVREGKPDLDIEGMNLTGKGEIVAVCDGGFDIGKKDKVHPDFEGRVIDVKSYPISVEHEWEVENKIKDSGAADISDGHGTHVAGSIVGSGAASKDKKEFSREVRGIAYEAELVFQAVEQEMEWNNADYYKQYGRFSLAGLSEDITDILDYAYKKGARVHSNSWAGSEPGAYDNTARLIDKFMWERRDMTVVVCAGNEGTDMYFRGEIEPMSIQSPATAKNVITVGASESLRPQFSEKTYGKRWPKHYPVAPFWASPMANNHYQVIAFSSRGPTQDGRIKPDVVAPGSYILSTRSRAIPKNVKGWGVIPDNFDYFFLGGTSMATPLVSGVCALLRQFFREYCYIRKPSSALIKASLICGAIKLPNYSPADILADNHQGYGRVNLKNIAAPDAPAESYFWDAQAYGEKWDKLNTGDFVEFRFKIASGDVPLRIAMAYTDYPGPNLVNNLNLLLFRTDAAGNKHYHVGYGESDCKRIPDAVNNTEVIEIRKPTPGEWVLQVIASNVPKGPQTYALAFIGHFKEGPQQI